MNPHQSSVAIKLLEIKKKTFTKLIAILEENRKWFKKIYNNERKSSYANRIMLYFSHRKKKKKRK